MYLKIKFIFYLTNGMSVEEDLYYQKKDSMITPEAFEKEVRGIEAQYREQLSEALITKHNKILAFGDTVLADTSIIGFKSYIEPMEQMDSMDSIETCAPYPEEPVEENDYEIVEEVEEVEN